MFRFVRRLLLVLICSTFIVSSGVASADASYRRPNRPNINNNVIIVQTITNTIPNNAAADLAVTCPAGRIATGGGGAIGSGGIAGGAITTTAPFPVGVVNNPTGWHVIAANASGVAQPLTVWVLCVRIS